MKKTLLIITNILLLGLMVLASFYLFNVIENRQITAFIKEKQSHLHLEDNQELQEGNIGQTHVIAYFPKDKDGKRIKPIEDLIDQNLQNTVGSDKPSGKIKKLLFVSTTDMPTNIPSVHRTEITTQSYKYKNFKISTTKNKDPQAILLTSDNQLFTLAHLFSDLEKAKAILEKKVESDLGAKGISTEDIALKLEAFRQLDMQGLAFTYEVSQVMIRLPEEQVGLDQVTLDVSDCFDAVNQEYLSEKDLQAFEAYQVEKQRMAQEKMIALTFDDGPNPATTTAILDTLKRHNAKATFFILGQNIAGNEEIIKRMVAEGHEVANHSWSHPNFVNLSPEQVKQEVEQTQAALEKITGQRPALIRPPYGAVNQRVMSAMNLPAMYWSVDSLDWQSRNPQSILGVVQANTRPGSIILMHDIHKPTADSLESVLQYLESQQYTLATLSEMLGNNLDPNLIYYDRGTARPAQ